MEPAVLGTGMGMLVELLVQGVEIIWKLTVDRTGGQVDWLGGQRLEWRGWSRHLPSISDL
jgi:hypothetical protein